MFSYRVDRAYGNCVWLFSGNSNSDDDYRRYIATFPILDAIASHHELAAGILLVERDNPVPNAVWRKRMAAASERLASRPLVGFASESAAIRGVVTAINWLRPPPFEFHVASSFDDNVRWIESRRGAPAKLFFSMLAELYGELER